MTQLESHLGRIMVLALLCAACSGETSLTDDAQPAVTELREPTSTYSALYEDDDKWLCRPGLPNNPCTAKLTIADFLADGSTKQSTLPATNDDASADCFFLYATVDPGLLTPPRNLDFPDIDRGTVTDLMFGQARPFRDLCNIYAPLYRQASLNTFQADDKTRQEHLDYAYRDVEEAFDYFLAHTAPQRPIVLLSHSQGSHHTIRLLQRRFETDRALRKRLVVVVLAGPLGGFRVPRSDTLGGSLKEIPLCTSAEESGCALTFNTFLSTTPPDQSYGAIGRGGADEDSDLGCNPGFYTPKATRLRGSLFVTRSPALIPTNPLNPDPRRANVDYARYPEFYTGHCVPADNGLTYLSIAIDPLPGDRRNNPVDFDSILVADPSVGLHVLDYAFVSGDLVEAARIKLAAHNRE